jgi:hypothetical protein
LRQKWSVGNSVWGKPGCSAVINSTLTIGRPGGRGGGGTPMLVRPAGRDQRPWNKGLLSNRSTSGPFAFAWKSHDRGATLSSLTWPSTASFAPATWSNFGQTTFTQEQRCGIGPRSFKRRQVDQSSSKSRSSRVTPLKPGNQRSGPLAPDISSQVDFTQGPTYPPANTSGWCIAGLKASA